MFSDIRRKIVYLPLPHVRLCHDFVSPGSWPDVLYGWPLNLFTRLPCSGGAEVVGALRTTLLLGPPMVNKFQAPDTKTTTNVVGYFMIFLNYDAPE